MSKKTKKEKIMADLRKQTLFQPVAPVQSQSLYIYPVHLIKKDLTKTLLLSILAISFEIALYFLL